jgi:type IV pilus assembly protein PilB
MKRLFGLDKKADPQNDGAVAVNSDVNDEHLIRGLSNLYSPQPAEDYHVRDIADVLLEMGKIDDQQLDKVHREGHKSSGNIEQAILHSGIATTDDILAAKARLYGFEFRHIEAAQVDRVTFDKLDLDYIRSSHIMPIAVENDTLVIATSEPANVFAIDDVKRQTKMPVRVVVATESDIDSVCSQFDETEFNCNVDEIMSDMADIEVVKDIEQDTEDLEKSAGESPVIKFVNYLLTNALRENASDIHIEPKEKYTKIRYRIDGILFDTMQAPAKMHPAIVSRLKIMSNLDISERRLPQDGKISVIMGGRGIDLRVSILPTSRGEKVVVRLLDSASILRGLDDSGMGPEILEAFKEQVALPHGILLVTGPTGSGKSTTLYSALAQMDGETMNISTVEDPVEYNLHFCNQVQANEKIGLTFAAALRSLLRQDPDIMMIGEIRDNETAKIAVQAALTGHLVLSTLHTNDAPSSITRLVNIGIDPYLVAASLNAVLAQRLVRRICPDCKKAYKIPKNMRKYVERTGIKPSQLMHGAGCDKCRKSGYLGRLGIFELLIIDDKFRNIINEDTSVNSIRRAFTESGQPALFDDGIEKVKHGLTTIEEVLRVTQIGEQSEEEVAVDRAAEAVNVNGTLSAKKRSRNVAH